MNNTLALIKPDAMQKGFKDKIRKDLLENGFLIIEEKTLKLSVEQLKVFIPFIKINHFSKNLLNS